MPIVVERFSPRHFSVPWVRRQHLARYRWAGSLVRGQRVLDIACGTGYGSLALARAGAERVVGMDRSQEALTEAATYSSDEAVSFLEGEATHTGLQAGAFDAVVSFETIEHLTDDRAFLEEVRRVLRPGGMFVCSSPNRDILDPGTSLLHQPFNQHHVREYSVREFTELLESCFSKLELFGQCLYSHSYASLLGAVGRRHPGLAVRTHQARKVLEYPFRGQEWYVPRALGPGESPEVLLVKCVRTA